MYTLTLAALIARERLARAERRLRLRIS